MIQPAAQLGGEVGVDTWVKFGSRFAFGDAKRDGLSGSRSQEWERVKLYSGRGKTRTRCAIVPDSVRSAGALPIERP